jgi:hypothetical protein
MTSPLGLDVKATGALDCALDGATELQFLARIKHHIQGAPSAEFKQLQTADIVAHRAQKPVASAAILVEPAVPEPVYKDSGTRII